MRKQSEFRSALVPLWFRLTTLAIVGLLFTETLSLARGKLQGWTFYLTSAEVVFEVVVRFVFVALGGMALGSVCTAALAPFLWYFKASRDWIAGWATKVAVVLVVFLNAGFAVTSLARLSNRAEGVAPVLLAIYVLAFAVALCLPRTRRRVVTSLDGVLTDRVTRRTAVATVAGTAALIATEFAIGRSARIVKAALVPQQRNSNLLLITFDALSAEDMSLYGYGLPTTPNIDAFAARSSVFTNFYSAATFTTPSVAAMMTGMYPSESGVYHLQGQLRGNKLDKSLPRAMRTAGYATGAFVSNPFAYYFGQGLEDGYDFLPEPVFQSGGLQHLWNATKPLHQDTGFGSRIDEYLDVERVWNFWGRMPIDLSMRLRPAETFEQARQMISGLPAGFFLWVHVITPHAPYLPDSTDQGRFLPERELRSFENEPWSQWKPVYPPDQQGQVSRRRLAYDEYVATADRAFGKFISDVENDGKLRNTTVIVSADHGESFEGGVYQHESRYQTRPIIHIPLIIRTPDQQDIRKIALTCDQTALAPTMLELLGLPRPDWLPSRSLVPWLNNDGPGDREGLAFTQHLEKNSVFKPLRHGTIGVIDGQYQYVVSLDSQEGALRPLNEAQIWDLDRSAENPARARQLHAAIASRFPDLIQKTA
ncbi:MAG: sulfatase [Candidatus Korobacteraceae bacterium]